MIRHSLFLVYAVSMLLGCEQISSIGNTSESHSVVKPSECEALIIRVPALNLQSYAVWNGQNGSVETWRTAQGISISLNNGVIVSTRGMGDDLMGADVEQSVAILADTARAWGLRINSYIDGENQHYFTSLQCRRSDTRMEQTTIGNRSQRTTRLTELCVNNEKKIENTYWQNSSGSVLKSRQWVSSGVGYIEIERVLR